MMKESHSSIPLAVMAGLVMFASSASAQVTKRAHWDKLNNMSLPSDADETSGVTASISNIDSVLLTPDNNNGSGDGTFGSTLGGASTSNRKQNPGRIRIGTSPSDNGAFEINITNTGVDVLKLQELLFDFQVTDDGSVTTPNGYSIVFENITTPATSPVLGSDTGLADGWHDVDIDASSILLAAGEVGRFVVTLSGGNNTVSNGELDNIAITGIDAGDLTPPTPDPMTWAGVPTMVSESAITMTASTATDPEGGAVEYRFNNTTAGTDSGWQSSPTFIDTGLAPNTEYDYTVEARDEFENATAPSNPAVSATTAPADNTDPTPDPMTWASVPTAVSMNEITMTASTASDASGVEYYFSNLTDPTHDSDWQDSETYTDAGLLPGTLYSYTVKARDKSYALNETDPSTPGASATTDPATGDILYADSFERPDGTDLNFPFTGKSGTLGALTYTAAPIPAESDVDILSESLRINSTNSDGVNGGLVYINDHNFIDAAILSGGGFSASVDITEYNTTGSERPAGLSLGSSLAELDGQSAADGFGSPADLFVALRQTTDTLEIYKNGVLDAVESVSGALVPTAPTTMRVECSFLDFNSGSTVTYKVFFDDVEATNGSFTWSGTDENYIGLQSNTTNNTRFDNLEIRSGVTAVVNDFSTWIDTFFPGETDLAIIGLDADPDGDGVDSGVENFFGTAPDTFTQGLISGTVDTGAGTFTFVHPQTGSIADDLTATYQWSVDLANFFADGVADGGVQVDFVATPDTPSAGTTTVVATVTGPIPEKLFVNVEVTQP